MAYGYFIHNILVVLNPQKVNEYLWFPENGKEIFKDGEIFRLGAGREQWETGFLDNRNDNRNIST